MRQVHIRALAATGVAALALAACGSSSKPSSSSASPTTTVASTNSPTTGAAPTTAVSANPTVKLASTKLGMVLVDDKGRTLYRFDNDTTPGKSTCGPGVCASTWPALIVTGTPTAGPGIKASNLSTFKRDDGTMQLQIEGHPLYMFAGDTKPGDTNGQGILGKWYAVTADGDKAGDNS
jgi:predicted lipoprotein with Yx(FWY)xxD motif